MDFRRRTLKKYVIGCVVGYLEVMPQNPTVPI
jgi:hypothetical protein